MQDWEKRLDHLEACNDILTMQNRVLATAIKGLLRALPQEIMQEAVESIQAAFEDEIAELGYTHEHHADLFQDVAYEFFRDKN
ncbi:MAG: hypothetical protein Q4B82_06815 [Alysiella sp.]|uniref:NGO1151 family protein n=1 Tax=Alysiella sp. TaxID=1872483 RepID=UPI0026DB99A2|nr:hypothetical protein [Alysiella sp.]MDO4434274.1 hypothetical protein [Alysiella sp.]